MWRNTNYTDTSNMITAGMGDADGHRAVLRISFMQNIVGLEGEPGNPEEKFG